MRVGALCPNSGAFPIERGIPQMARALEDAGFESLWVSDHVVLPETIESWYPFAADGKATWPSATPYVDAMVALALIAGATERATIGTAVLVLPLRQPVVLAKQAASIDVASGGRLRLGVGAGWLKEEFDALDVPFDDRSGRLVEWMQIARSCWTGTPPPHESERYTLPAGTLCLPTPTRPIPFLMGGHAPAALAEAAAGMRAAAAEAGRDPDALEVVLRVVDSAGRPEEMAAALPALAEAGVDEIIVNVDWQGDLAAQYATIAASAA